jgi:hypothetical protein
LLFESRSRVGRGCEHHFIGRGFRHIAIPEDAPGAIDAQKVGAKRARPRQQGSGGELALGVDEADLRD